MKTILVLSDSHGNKKALDKLEMQMEKADYIFHLGDHYYDMKDYLEKFGNKIYTVFGNCDGGGDDYEIFIEGVKILLTHGDRYHVKSSLLRLSLEAQERKCRLVFYGHTHRANIVEDYGVILANPGTLERCGEKTYLIAEIDDGKIDLKHYNLEEL